MSAEKSLRSLVSNSPNQEFWIDEHALEKLERHVDLNWRDITTRLRKGKFERVRPNDSAEEGLAGMKSFIVTVRKSSNYLYDIVIYESVGKPLIKTVYEIDSGMQAQVG